MPNFRARTVRLATPCQVEGVSFLWVCEGEGEVAEDLRLVFTRVEDEEFFLQVKRVRAKQAPQYSGVPGGYGGRPPVKDGSGGRPPAEDGPSPSLLDPQHSSIFKQENFKNGDGENDEAFIIKVDKNSAPAKIGLIQRALAAFERGLCADILSRSFALKNSTLAAATPLIASSEDELLARLGEFGEAKQAPQGGGRFPDENGPTPSLRALSSSSNFKAEDGEKGEGEAGQKSFKKILIEIGFGSGRHLLFLAKKHPDALILGLEIYTPAINQLAKRAQACGLENILLARIDARGILPLLEGGSVDKIFLHFPIPWDKNPARRVISQAFVREVARVLGEGGSFELRTDSRAYFDLALDEFLALDVLDIRASKNAPPAVASKYEERWRGQGRDLYELELGGFKQAPQGGGSQVGAMIYPTFSADELLKLKKNFTPTKLVREDLFVSLEKSYVLKKTSPGGGEMDEGLVLKLTLGQPQLPGHFYFLFVPGREGELLFRSPPKSPAAVAGLGLAWGELFKFIKGAGAKLGALNSQTDGNGEEK